MKVSATLKGTPDQLGRKTVYIRVADGAKRKFFATSIKLEPKHWNKKVVGHPQAKQLNERIKQLILSTENNPVEKTSLTFHAYALQCLSQWENTKREGTINQLRSKVNKFKDFYSGPLALSPEILTRYVEYCYSLGNQTNTVWTSLKAIRVIIGKARREKLIPENPFDLFDMPKYKDPQKVYLTKKQVESIEKELPNLANLKISAAWFLISCYTGLRFGDQKAFNKSKIRDGRLIVYTSKTGKVVSIKMNNKLKELFKIVDYKPLPYSNEHYNRSLKAIAGICKIPEKVSAHTARHTFGTLCASAGISQEVAAALMGHNSIRTTAIYYQITGTRIDSEFEKIF